MHCEPLAKGDNYQMEDRYNPQHIDSLPPEIRKSILCQCDEPKASHPFASYSDGSKRIELHFEHFVGPRRTNVSGVVTSAFAG
jgi:hypothetical protein